jgi:hypothetical protein
MKSTYQAQRDGGCSKYSQVENILYFLFRDPYKYSKMFSIWGRGETENDVI